MLQHLLPPNRWEAPRKKRRGLRRYFRRVLSRAEELTLDVSDSAWYDFWHDHPDWYGYGNLSWPMRARHLEALAKAFNRFAQQLNQFRKPYQLWIFLDVRDSAQDSVYVHSPNPNHDDFPVVLDGTTWGVDVVSQYFEALLSGYRLRAGVKRHGDSACYFVYALDVGLALEKVKP